MSVEVNFGEGGALLTKWFMCFYDTRVTGAWKTILIEKYGVTGISREMSSLSKTF